MLDYGPSAAWQALTGMSQNTLQDRLLHGLPAETGLALKYYGADTFGLTFRKPGGFTANYMLTAGESLLVDSFNSYMPDGAGISGRVHANFLPLLPRMNITRLELNAVNIGRYHWARAGFTPDPLTWNFILKRAIARDFKAVQHLVPAPVCCDVAAALNNPDPKAFWTLVDQTHPVQGRTLGKFLSLGDPQDKSWDGACDLADPDCRQRFEAHIRRQPPPAWPPGRSAPHPGI